MGFEFSKDFIERYSGEKSDDINEIIDNVYKYCDRMKAPIEYKELTIEALYAFKISIADKYGIDMKEIYPRVGMLGIVDEKAESRDSEKKVFGYCEFKEDLPYPLRIHVNPFQSEEGKKVTYIHELCHVMSTNIDIMEIGIIEAEEKECWLDKSGFKDMIIDELATVNITRKMCEVFGYNSDISFSSFNYDSLVPELSSVKTNSTYFDYPRVSETSKIFELLYGDDFYRSKFRVDGAADKILSGEDDSSLALVLDKMDREKANSADIMKLTKELLKDLNKKYNIQLDNNGFAHYIADFQYIQNCDIRFKMESNRDVKDISYFSQLQSGFEIREIYAKYAGLTNAEDIAKELNPSTRSTDCYNFLMAMDCLKHIDKSYTSEELWNMSYEKVSVLGKNFIKVYVGDDEYQIHSSVNSSTGLISSDLDGLSELNADFSMGRVAQRAGNLFPFLERDGKEYDVEISFTDMCKTNKYSGIYTNICRDGLSNWEFGYCSNSIKDPSVMLPIALASDCDYKQILSILSDAQDIRNIRDFNNNNIFHIIATNDKYSSAASINAISDAVSCKSINSTVLNLVNSPNKDGETPLDIAYRSGNMKFVAFCIEHELIDRVEFNRFPPKVLNYTENAFLPIEEAIITESVGDSHLINEALKNKIKLADSFDYYGVKGETLLHLYARGELEGLLVHEVINKGGRFTSKNGDGVTPIDIVVEKADIEKTFEFIKYGADSKECLYSLSKKMEVQMNTPDKEIIDMNQARELLKTLLDKTKSYYKIDEDRVPLQIMAGACRKEDLPAKISANDGNFAIDYKSIEILLKAGYSPFLEVSDVLSLRNFAAEIGDAKLFKLMIEAGCDEERLKINNSNLSFGDKIMLTELFEEKKETEAVQTIHDTTEESKHKELEVDKEELSHGVNNSSKDMEAVCFDPFEM